MLKISILQMETIFGRPSDNLEKLKQRFPRVIEKEQPDVILLPELWTTGFYPEPLSEFAEAADGPVIKNLSALARQYKVHIIGGSVIIGSRQHFFNRCHIFNRQGEQTAVYDKTHLFSPGHEQKVFTPGETLPPVFLLDGIPCSICICYDLRFPELLRTVAQQISILFLPAAWPLRRLVHWQTLLRARAIENQIFVAAANTAGRQPTMHCAGHSAVIDPWGEILAEAGEKESILSAKLDTGLPAECRSRIPVWEDCRPELYTLNRK